jgi:hypothetical protein
MRFPTRADLCDGRHGHITSHELGAIGFTALDKRGKTILPQLFPGQLAIWPVERAVFRHFDKVLSRLFWLMIHE